MPWTRPAAARLMGGVAGREGRNPTGPPLLLLPVKMGKLRPGEARVLRTQIPQHGGPSAGPSRPGQSLLSSPVCKLAEIMGAGPPRATVGEGPGAVHLSVRPSSVCRPGLQGILCGLSPWPPAPPPARLSG